MKSSARSTSAWSSSLLPYPSIVFRTHTAALIALQTLEALRELHTLGYVHQALKPGHIAASNEVSAKQQSHKL